MTVFHLVRHGHVENPHKIVYGRQRGWRLSARGEKEAEAVARHLAGRPIARVYTSPLERAVQTATVIAGACGSEVEPREDLSEAFLCAQWEGLSWRDVRHGRAADWAQYLFRPLEITGVPEDLRALAERMTRALGQMAEAHPSEQVVAVSHGDPIKAVVLAVTDGDLRDLHREPVPTGGLVTLEYDLAGTARVVERWSARKG